MYSSQSRYLIYQKAKEMYLSDISEGAFFGMCLEITCASMNIFNQKIYCVDVPGIFPEMKEVISKHDPEQVKENGLLWDRKDTEIRIKMFDQIIEQAKQQSLIEEFKL